MRVRPKTSMSIRLDSEVMKPNRFSTAWGMIWQRLIIFFFVRLFSTKGCLFDVRLDESRKAVIKDLDQIGIWVVFWECLRLWWRICVLKIRYHKQFKKDFKLRWSVDLRGRIVRRSLGAWFKKRTSCCIDHNQHPSTLKGVVWRYTARLTG